MYDYTLTLSLEVSTVWKSKLSGTSILFLVNRYLSMVNGSVIIFSGLSVTGNINVSFVVSPSYIIIHLFILLLGVSNLDYTVKLQRLIFYQVASTNLRHYMQSLF